MKDSYQDFYSVDILLAVVSVVFLIILYLWFDNYVNLDGDDFITYWKDKAISDGQCNE